MIVIYMDGSERTVERDVAAVTVNSAGFIHIHKADGEKISIEVNQLGAVYPQEGTER